MNISYIDPSAVQESIEKETRFSLIDTLSGDHFIKVHIPGAINICVYEANFLQQVASLIGDLEKDIVLYGSGGQSSDAIVAAEKLSRAGYQNIQLLQGGLKRWRQAGYALTGEGFEQDDSPETLLKLTDGIYRLVSDQSSIEWAGRNRFSKHHGIVNCNDGNLTIRHNKLTGQLEVDMTSMANINLVGDDLQPVLMSHLKSDDFFFVERFPTALLTIREGSVAGTPYLTTENCTISGELKLRGVTADLDFMTTLTTNPDGSLQMEAHFDLDRTRWKIIYGSARFFEFLGMHQVFDTISVQLRLLWDKSALTS
jgi:rhodanese-related sulfurtransferase/polyisoprenoid-binding protein YceI